MNALQIFRVFNRRSHATAAIAISLLFLTQPAHGFQFGEGDWSGSFYTTVSFGGLYRLKGPDPHYYGRANGGLQ